MEAAAGREEHLLGMWDEVYEVVRVAFDLEIKAPPAVDSGLPDVAGLVVLLGAERRVAKVLKKEGYAAVNGSLDVWRRTRVALEEAFGIDRAH